MEPTPSKSQRIAAALRQISKGYAALADAISSDPAEAPEDARYRSLLADWGEQGLTRPEASALFRKHGFPPQAAGGWARGGWLEVRGDGRRHLTARSLDWLAEQEAADE